jgi:hypothetical protein
MEKKPASRFEEIIHYYGSLEAYYEEQRRFGLVSIEAAVRADPFRTSITIENPMPVEVVKVEKERRIFWLKFLGQQA